MSEAVTTKKSALTPSALSAAPVKAEAQSLREVQIKKFPPSSLQSLGQDFDILAVRAPADWTEEDCLAPGAWANVAALVAKDALNTRRDKIGSLIYVRHEGGAFKLMLSIEAITHDKFGSANGLLVSAWIRG